MVIEVRNLSFRGDIARVSPNELSVASRSQSVIVMVFFRAGGGASGSASMADIASFSGGLVPGALSHGAMTGRLTGASAPAMREAAQSAYRAQRQESRGSDQVQISPSAKYLAMMKGLPEVREDLVEDAKARIASGEMDTPERLSDALDEMMSDFDGRW